LVKWSMLVSIRIPNSSMFVIPLPYWDRWHCRNFEMLSDDKVLGHIR
jgi:hypothetical protein